MDVESRSEEENEQGERERLISTKSPLVFYFRSGREERESDAGSQFVRTVFKVIFYSLGLWGQQKWVAIPRLLFGAICIYQAIYDLYVVVGCPGFDCGFLQNSTESTNKTKHKNDRQIANTVYTLFSLAAVISYLLLVTSFIIATRLDSALVHPSQAMENDIRRTDLLWLLVSFVFILLSFSASVAIFYHIIWNQPRNSFFDILATGVAAQFLAQWIAIISCHVFAVSSLALGTLADDTIRRIRNLQTGNLDDIIKIHEDLCTVVINTVWSHSFWFIIHWFTYGLGVVLTVIYVCDEFHLRNEYNTPVTNLAYIVLLLICHLYIFLFPCICAARITSACTGIYEKINRTTSEDWPIENHPFKDRRNIAMFVSYAKDRHCGFQIGKITFNSSLAWMSFFLGLTGMLFHFF